MRLARSRQFMPSASYSTWFHPIATPRRTRPRERTSRVAACLATRTVCRCGRMTMPNASSSFFDRRQETEQHERLVERIAMGVCALPPCGPAARFGADDVVVRDQMRVPEILRRLREG